MIFHYCIAHRLALDRLKKEVHALISAQTLPHLRQSDLRPVLQKTMDSESAHAPIRPKVEKGTEAIPHFEPDLP